MKEIYLTVLEDYELSCEAFEDEHDAIDFINKPENKGSSYVKINYNEKRN